ERLSAADRVPPHIFEKLRNVLRYEPIQRLFCFQRNRSSHCPSRSAQSSWRESTGRGSVPRLLQHYTEPAPILRKEEIRLDIHTGDGFEARNRIATASDNIQNEVRCLCVAMKPCTI